MKDIVGYYIVKDTVKSTLLLKYVKKNSYILYQLMWQMREVIHALTCAIMCVLKMWVIIQKLCGKYQRIDHST